MQYLRSLVARIRAWFTGKRPPPIYPTGPEHLLSFSPMILRDVTPTGVRVYSVCGGCGARLECSATLCEECARGPHTSRY